MANYPQLDNASGVWNLSEFYDAVIGGYWPNANSIGLFSGGFNPGSVSTINKITISTTGDATTFGDLSRATGNTWSVSSFIRSINSGASGGSNTIDYVSFTSEGNAADFGDLTAARDRHAGLSNSIRGVYAAGYSPASPSFSNVIDYITMASTGNAIDFGDATQARVSLAGASSPTRGLFMGGTTATDGSVKVNTTDFVQIMTTGNATDFGDLATTRLNHAGTSSSTRAVDIGGTTETSIEFLTIASQGNGIDYGDLTAGKQTDATSNSVRSVNYGGSTSPALQNSIDFFTITNGGTTTDFGDAVQSIFRCRGSSNSHGGLNDGYQGTRPLPFNEAGG